MRTLSIKPIRIAFCIDSFEIGGTELNAIRTVEALDRHRFQITVFHLQQQGPLRARYDALHINTVHVPIPNLYSARTAMQGLRFGIALRKLQIDVVHTHDLYTNIFAGPWAKMAGRGRVLASRRWWYDAPRTGLGTLNRLSYHFADRVLANSAGVARLLRQEERIAERKIVEIPNFLDETAFVTIDENARDSQRREWGVPQGSCVVGIVARLAPVKNHQLLIHAMPYMNPAIHVVCVGDGPSRSELTALAASLNVGDRVHFAGEMRVRENLHDYFDISVLCSTSEGFPNSIIEALAARRPVVATPVGGVVDVITDGVTGALVPLGEPKALAHVLEALRSDPDRAATLGLMGQRLVSRRYRRDAVIGKLSAVYSELAIQ